MKIKYYSKIIDSKIEMDVNPKVAHYLKEDKKAMRKVERAEKDYVFSLERLMENGFQPSSSMDALSEMELNERERKYLNSHEYKRFKTSLQEEIQKKMDVMSPRIRQIMFLRFFKNMSIGAIGKDLGLSKGATQEFIRRGCKYIKNFLDEDIKNENRKEYERKMKNIKKN